MLKGLLEKNNATYGSMVNEVNRWIDKLSCLIKSKECVENEELQSFVDESDSLYERAKALDKKIIIIASEEKTNFKELFDSYNDLYHIYREKIEKHNNEILKSKIDNAKKITGLIDGYYLDEQQLYCITQNSNNQNVVAGAGTGKTTTILGKIKYLLGTNQYKPEDILVLSYTRDAAKEMKERVERSVHENIAVSTFHRFGYYVLTKALGKKPNICNKELREIVKSCLSDLLKSSKYRLRFILLIGSLTNFEKIDIFHDFKSKDEYDDYIKECEPISLDGVKVKSYGELRIANFLYVNGIDYIYENAYEVDTADEEHRQYYPDFYLPKEKIYIEFFGIDKNGNVPYWFEGDNPKQTYNDSILWKRQLHEEHGTCLIESYAYETLEGSLETNLERKLKEHNVAFNSRSFDEIFAKDGNNYKYLVTFIEGACAIIQLARNKRVHSKELYELANDLNVSQREHAYLVSLLLKGYEDYLNKNNLVDYTDMLNLSADYIKEKKYTNTYKYIIVDEYQDMTVSQYNFLKALRDSNFFKLFCVGDDWQSIYQFNGSDISYIMNFEKYWGVSTLSRIETTYRFPHSLINVSSNFIMKNPSQIRKNIKSKIADVDYGVTKIVGYKKETAIRYMGDRLMYLPKDSTVFLLSRYSFDYKMLTTDDRFNIKYDTATQNQMVYFTPRKDLKMCFHTIHGSKGLQADYVFVLNNQKDRFGFPSEINDSVLKSRLLNFNDKFPNAEERRLFYVALTRAKKKVVLLTVKNKESDFIKELERTFEIPNESYICPKCGGNLHKKRGKFGDFLGCSNYKTLNCKFTIKLDNQENS